ncbi:hypothetical protein DFH09DRAFT_1106971 [Mycena vulgaris]|nr:hypothetical protein DFH09DRAFT_1106971 [Mycena vulgaris]
MERTLKGGEGDKKKKGRERGKAGENKRGNGREKGEGESTWYRCSLEVKKGARRRQPFKKRKCNFFAMEIPVGCLSSTLLPSYTPLDPRVVHPAGSTRRACPYPRARLGLPPVAVATVRRHPSNGCRARPFDHFFRHATARQTTAATAVSAGHINFPSIETPILNGIHFPACFTFLLAPNRRYIACIGFSATPDHDCRKVWVDFSSWKHENIRGQKAKGEKGDQACDSKAVRETGIACYAITVRRIGITLTMKLKKDERWWPGLRITQVAESVKVHGCRLQTKDDDRLISLTGGGQASYILLAIDKALEMQGQD